MTVVTLRNFDLMPRQRTNSHDSRRPLIAEMKARQSARIREIAEALVEGGLVTLDAQADALGLCRSTAWTILKSSHKSSGLSAKVISRILAEPQLPERVRATLLKYVEEKASGRYGHSAKTRRKFITALSIKRLEQQAEARRVKAAAAATAARPAVLAKAVSLDEAFRETVNVSRKRPRSRQAS